MYKEEIITTKARALACAKVGLLFWHDAGGGARLASVPKVRACWGIYDFFVCTHAKPAKFVAGE